MPAQVDAVAVGVVLREIEDRLGVVVVLVLGGRRSTHQALACERERATGRTVPRAVPRALRPDSQTMAITAKSGIDQLGAVGYPSAIIVSDNDLPA